MLINKEDIGEVVCVCLTQKVDNFTQQYYNNITIGKKYSAKFRSIGNNKLDLDIYWIYDDNMNYRGIDKNCFMTISEIRHMKLESIGV